MARNSKAVVGGLAGTWSGAGDREDRWSIPHTAMLVTVVSATLWALIVAGVRWLIGQ